MNIMKWENLVNSQRIGGRPSKDEKNRSPFNSDHDKIIFSGAFRRLARKTQVHPLATNDHIHNRLTHSLEVACVGRSLGIKVGQMLVEQKKIPENISASDIGDIVQSTCLAHDIGNPPFGHTGESAIRSWFSNEGSRFLEKLHEEESDDLKMFEGNAQGLRVLTSAEYHPYDGGMRLTYATLGSFIKYPWTASPSILGNRPKRDKFGVFQSELEIFHEIANATGLLRRSEDDWYCRHPLVCLMAAADDFCYALLDLEDALEMGILSWKKIFEIVEPVLPDGDKDQILNDLKNVRDGRKPPIIRGRIMDAYVNSAAGAFMENESRILQGEGVDLVKLCGGAVAQSVSDAKQIAKEYVFNHPRKIELEIGSYSVISTILEVMCTAVNEYVVNPKNYSFKSKRVLDLIGEETFDPKMKASSGRNTPSYLALMRVIDFVGGCTDHYATYLAKQFNGMGEAR